MYYMNKEDSSMLNAILFTSNSIGTLNKEFAMTDQDVTPPQEPQPVEPPSTPEQPQPSSTQPQYPPKELLPEVAVPVQPQYAPPPLPLQPAVPVPPQYPAQQLQSQPAMPVQPQASQGDMVRALAATKSYYGAALITLVLYWLTFWIGGIIANIIYLNSASNTQRLSGVSPEGKGCLWILLITHVILPLAGICLLYAFGLSGVLFGGTQVP